MQWSGSRDTLIFFSVLMGLLLGVRAGAVTNAGGVLLLHAETGLSYSPGMEICKQGTLLDWRNAVTRLPGDGANHVAFAYAAFPPDSIGQISALCFGVKYSPNVQIVAYGACNSGGLIIPTNEWPKSGTGMSVYYSQLPAGDVIPLYYFVLTATGPGFFELAPNPVPNLGANFADPSIPSHVEPIAGLGRIGFELEGTLPRPGRRALKGACCLGQCVMLAELECDYYRGVYLGDGVTCELSPCDSAADRGACCTPTGCVLMTRLDCKHAVGEFFGELTVCDSIPCSKPTRGGAKSEGQK